MVRIRLDTLQLNGFKSFPDGVELSFPGDIVTVIGPNGCGKSNIVDAILWVLGEQSPKLLRAKTMGDVVFAGTGKRKPAGAAEVTLTLASDDGRWADSGGRLTLRRRVFRDGPSEYRMNGKTARLRDVMDELLAIGLGTRDYAIIGQERVTQVLSARPTDRRVLIEEAAGITHYRVRKHEAELRLEHTRQNLQRLEDVISEVDRSLRQLKRQSRQAERYRKVEEELREQTHILYALRTHSLNGALEEVRTRRKALEDETAGAASNLGRAEADLVASRRRLEEGHSEIEEARKEVGTLLASRERLEAFLERSADLLDSLRTGLERSRNQAAAAAEAQHGLDERRTAAASHCSALAEALEEVAGRRADAEEAAGAARTALEQAEGAAEERRRELLRSISSLTSGRNHLRDLERAQDRLSYAGEQLAQESERLLERRSDVRTRLAAARKASAEEVEAVAELTRKRDDLARDRSALGEELAAAAAAADDSGHRLWELKHRLAGADRELSRRTVALDQVAAVFPEESLGGQVSDYLNPDSAVAPVFDRVWAEWLELPVVRLTSLPDAIRDRVASLDSRLRIVLAGDPPAPREVDEVKGAVPLLPEAGIAAEELGWLTRVLPSVFRCPTREMASNLAEDHPALVFVAPDETVFRGRSVEPPTAGGRVKGLLALRGEREALANEVAVATLHMAEEQRLQAKVKVRLGEVESELDAVSSVRLEAEQERVRASAMEQSLAEELHRLERELEAVDSERERSDAEREAAVARRVELEEELVELEKRGNDLEGLVQRASEIVDTKRETAAEAIRTLDNWRAEERLARERTETAEAEVARFREEVDSLVERQSALEQEVQELQGKLAATEAEVIRSRTRLAEEQGLLAAAREQERRLGEAAREVAGRVAALEKEVTAARSAHDGVRTQLHELDVDQTRLETEWERLAEAVGEEVGKTLEALLEEEAPNAEVGPVREGVEQLRQRLEKLGPVNLLAIQEVEDLGERSLFLHDQREDLVASLRSLNTTIREIDVTCTDRFMETLERVNAVFAETFSYLFGGGTARLDLADEDDPLESGILITAQPPGKKNQSVQLLSGGEKALTALSLLIALFRIKPSPFCILDEVDAPLDDANVERLAEMVRDMTEHTQFVMITHNRRTMTRADVLYGVTMEEAGVSKIVSVRMET